MSSVDVRVGERLIAARDAVGMSQRDLEQYSGISQPTIHRIETGRREASILELSALADACGVLIADLQGNSTVADRVLCAGRTNDTGTQALAAYMIYAFGLSQRLDELGVSAAA
ncbi:helix-turn-helix domain-containing protein [Microbacterium aurum]